MLRRDRATYWSSGGDILTPNHVLSDDDARALLDVHVDEMRAALTTGDLATAQRTRQSVEELTGAMGLAHRWRRAGRPARMGAQAPARR